MHFKAYFIFMYSALHDCKMLVSLMYVLETGNVILFGTSSAFPEHDREEFQKSVGNVRGLQPANPITTVHILSARRLVTCGSMNFDCKWKLLNNIKYGSGQVIQVKTESKALISAIILIFSGKIHKL